MYSLADEWGKPNKNFYALYAYGQLQYQYHHRVQALTTDDQTVLLAGKDDDGKMAIMCCVVTPNGEELRIAVKGLPKGAKFVAKELSAKKNLVPVRVGQDDGALILKMPKSPAVFLICSK